MFAYEFLCACIFKFEILFDYFYILLFGLKKCVSAPKHMWPQQDSFTDLLKLPIQVEHLTQLSWTSETILLRLQPFRY